MAHQLGYVLHRFADRFVPHHTSAYRVLDRVATRLYNYSSKAER
jgi:hypothetical protein